MMSANLKRGFESMADEVCRTCGNTKIFSKCLGCDASLCEACSVFELIGSGCGCVWPAYYCSVCALDPYINPNALFRDR